MPQPEKIGKTRLSSQPKKSKDSARAATRPQARLKGAIGRIELGVGSWMRVRKEARSGLRDANGWALLGSSTLYDDDGSSTPLQLYPSNPPRPAHIVQKLYAVVVPTVMAPRNPAIDFRRANGGLGRRFCSVPYVRPINEAAVSTHDRIKIDKTLISGIYKTKTNHHYYYI
jgi:hypothetical protein